MPKRIRWIEGSWDELVPRAFLKNFWKDLSLFLKLILFFLCNTTYYKERGMPMSTISLRLSEREHAILKNYAKLHNCNLSELIRTIVFERIEEEHDLKLFEEYEAEKSAGTVVTRPIEELWAELEL